MCWTISRSYRSGQSSRSPRAVRRVERLTIPADAHPEHERCQSAVRNSIQMAKDSAARFALCFMRLRDPRNRALDSPDLAKFAGRVSDSGAGRWTITAAIDESVPAPVLSAALYERFSSRGEDGFAEKVLCALRYGFGGHEENAATLWPARAQLFTREDAVEAAWAVVEPVLKTHHRTHPYEKGSWGPKDADVLIAADGCWHNPEPKEVSG